MPGKGMSFVLYVAVLAVSVTSVMMGLDWLSTPPPPVPKSVQTVRAPAKPVAPPAAKDAKETASAKSDASDATANSAAKQSDIAVAAPEAANGGPVGVVDNPQANASDGTPNIITNEIDMSGAAAQANASGPRCDVQACAARYHSFSASDCTYQPFDGPRRLCTVGNPPSQASDKGSGMQTSDASKPSVPSSCDVQACADAYRSFDPATCTWQPFEGPRRLCEK